MDKQHTALVPRDKPEYRDIFISSYLLWRCIKTSEIQMARIESDKGKIDLEILFSDIQFFLIAVSNIQRMMLRLRRLLGRNEDYTTLYKKHIKPLERLDYFRDNLEHF